MLRHEGKSNGRTLRLQHLRAHGAIQPAQGLCALSKRSTRLQYANACSRVELRELKQGLNPSRVQCFDKVGPTT